MSYERYDSKRYGIDQQISMRNMIRDIALKLLEKNMLFQKAFKNHKLEIKTEDFRETGGFVLNKVILVNTIRLLATSPTRINNEELKTAVRFCFKPMLLLMRYSNIFQNKFN